MIQFQLYGYEISIFQLLLIAYIVVYGIGFAVSNFFKRLVTLFTKLRYRQSSLGTILDWSWVFVIVVLIGTYQ